MFFHVLKSHNNNILYYLLLKMHHEEGFESTADINSEKFDSTHLLDNIQH